MLDAEWVRDIPLPEGALHGKEISSLSERKVILEFPPELAILLYQKLLLEGFYI